KSFTLVREWGRRSSGQSRLALFTHASQRIGMATVATTSEVPRSWLRVDLSQGRNLLGLLFLLPAATFLLVFLTYPLGLGVWLAFTDTRIGREGVFVGLENYELLWEDSVFWLSVFNTILYTVVASILKFALGLWLALILNNHLP